MGGKIMFCAYCGNQLPEEAKFCGGCGAKAEPVQPDYTTSEKSAPMRPAPTPPVNTPPVQTAPSHQQAYAPPQSTAYFGQQADEPLRVGQYLGMFLLLCVPILNIILLFRWGFGSSTNLNKKNYARATLILCAIMLVFWIVAGGIIGGALSSIIGGYY